MSEENMRSGVRYEHVIVKLSGEDGNAFAILGRVRVALMNADVCGFELDAFFLEATSGDYDHLIRTVMKWVEVE